MKGVKLIALALTGGALTFFATEASAVVCARGVYRAGCVGPNGAIVVRRAPDVVVVRPGGAVVYRRAPVYGGATVYRRRGYYGGTVYRRGPAGRSVVVRRRY